MNTYIIIYSSSFVVLIVWVLLWKTLRWGWFRPKVLEKRLRQQGLRGNSYRLLYGDLKESSLLMAEALSKPINLSDDIVPRVLPFVHDSINNHGQNSFIWLGPTPFVYIMDPELIKDVLIKFHDFQRPKSNPLIKLLASGVANYEGEKWSKHRKIINPAFHLDKLKHMLPAFYSSTHEMICKWEKMVSENGSCELDVWPYLETMTGDVISRTSFGNSYEEGRRIFELQKEQAKLAVQALHSVYIPGWRFVPTKRNKRMKEIDKEVRLLIKNIIDERVATMKDGQAREDDLLGILLESNLQEFQEHGNKNAGMSTEEVIEECKLFYFSGQETTSALLVWTMILLSMHPNWQERAREEVFLLFGNKKPDFDGLNRLKIITMIFYEVLRLYPPLVMLSRTVEKDTTLGETVVPSGVQIGLPTMLVHRNREIWGNDADEFKPERFSDGLSKAAKNQASYFPFSLGPRICIGQNFAMLEAKMALALILQCFSFELSSSYAHAPYVVVILQPQYGAHLILHKL